MAGFFSRESAALKEILLKLYRAETPLEIDHQIYEFGSAQYHVQASASDPHYVHLSISTSLETPGLPTADNLRSSTLNTLNQVYSDAIEVIESPKAGYQLTLRINFAKLPESQDECVKIISDISSLKAVILSSQLKEMLWHLGSHDTLLGMHKPIKLVYHPGEPFFIIRLPEKIIVIFPMRFKQDSDVVVATTLFQELMDVGCSRKFAKAPPCTWSPIPPSELRGEPFQDLSTNGGFVTFDIFSSHIEGSKLDKTVWNLLNFFAYVKNHVKCTRGFIQRRMRKKVENLSETLQKAMLTEARINRKSQEQRVMKKRVTFSKSTRIKRKCVTLIKKIRGIKVQGFDKFRRKWLAVRRFYSLSSYTKLD